MTRDEDLRAALRAVEEGLQVKVPRSGRPDQPYIGQVTRMMEDGTFWFNGRSSSETYSGKVNPADISFVRRKE